MVGDCKVITVIIFTDVCIYGVPISTDATVAPQSVMATVVSSTVITVQWNGLDPCRHVNGLIEMYRVLYIEVDSGVVQSKFVAGEWDVVKAETSLTGLTPFTNYSIQVAAVNEKNDVGVYSDPLVKQTDEDSESPEIGYRDIIILKSSLSHYSTWSSGHQAISLFFQNKDHLEPT